MALLPYTYYSKTEPRPFQRAALRASARQTAFALLFPPGMGKTYTTLANAAYLARQEVITGMLVLAPSGVHLQWVKDQLPEHWPDDLDYVAGLWNSDTCQSRSTALQALDNLRMAKSFAILAMNIDALRLDRAMALARRFVAERKTLIVADESTDIKSPSSLRGRRARRLSGLAKVRRILSATPMEKPFDLYGQFRFLDPRIIGARTYEEMKRTYAEWEDVPLYDPDNPDKTFPKFVRYVRLDELAQRIAPYSYRVSEQESGLPPLTYKTWRFPLPANLRAQYETLEQEHLLVLGSVDIDGSQTMVRMIRLQQLICGYVPVPLGQVCIENGEAITEPTISLPGGEARIKALLECLRYYPDRPTIVFCRFVFDEERITTALRAAGYTVSVYRGSVLEKHAIKREFTDGRTQIFVANAATAARGLDGLQRATLVVHYSTYFQLATFIQANYRAQRLGGAGHTLVVELTADDSIDEYLHHSREAKKAHADPILSYVEYYQHAAG